MLKLSWVNFMDKTVLFDIEEIKDASTQETCLWCDAFDCETPLNMFCGYGKFKKGDNQND